MKKLLELLGIILITSNAAGPLIANKPNNNKDKIKNSLETLTRQKRQAPPTKPDIIEKEITLDENYSDKIQKLLKDFMKNNQIDPFRMINNEGIVTTDYYETDKRKKEREDNLQIIKELDQILGLSKFDANKIRILILTLKNKDNKIRLVINLRNFYVLGFINSQNHYFYFDDKLVKREKDKNKEKIEELENIKNDLEQLNKLIKEKNKDNTKKVNLEWKIKEQLNKLKILEKWKEELKQAKTPEEKNKIEENIKNIDELIKEQINKAKDLDLLNKKLIEARKTKNTQQINETSQKIEELKKELNEAMGPIPAINNNNDKNYLNNKIKNLQGEGLKKDEDEIKSINAKVSEKCSIKEEQKHNLGYTGAYQPQGLNAVNQNITISQKTLKDAIANLADYDNNKQSQTTKDDLVQLLFVTSEAMRFGSYTKYFNHYYKDKDNLTKSSTSKPQTTPPSTGTTDNQVEFKNIPTNVQEILDGKINSPKWKDYEPQLIGGWIAASKDLEQKGKEIFKQLNDLIITNDFICDNQDKINKIFKEKNKYEKILESMENLFVEPENQNFKKIKDNDFLKQFTKAKLQELHVDWVKYSKDNIDILTQKMKNLEIEKKDTNDNYEELFNEYKNKELIKKVKNFNKNDNIFLSSIIKNNLLIAELILDKIKATEEVVNYKWLYDLTPLHIAAQNGHLAIVRLLLDRGADPNLENKDKATPLHLAVKKGRMEVVKELLINENSKDKIDVNARKSNNGKTPLHFAIEEREDGIVEFLIKNGADVNAAKSNNGKTPLHFAAQYSFTNCVVKKLIDKAKEKYTDEPEEFEKFINAQTSKKKKTALHYAVQYGHTDIVQELLTNENSKNKININFPNNEKNTPLHIAAQNGHLAVVKLLLAHGAYPVKKNKDNNTPLDLAEEKNRNSTKNYFQETIDLLKKHKENPNDNITMEWQSGDSGNSGSIGGDVGSDISSNVFVDEQSGTGGTQNQNTKRTNQEEATSPSKRPKLNDNEKYKKIAENIKNKDEATALHIAVKDCNKELVEFLIDKLGADVNAAKSNNGKTPLHFAAQYSYTNKVVKLLLDNGADVAKIHNDKWTTLHYAVQYGHTDIVQELLTNENSKNKIDVNFQNIKTKNTPLHIAAQNGHLAIVKLLLDNGADVNIPNKKGKTPLDLAEEKNHTETIDLLKKYKENPNDNITIGQHRGGGRTVGISKQAVTSGAQNQKTIVTNHNNLYDVPADGSCLFWSVATSYLVPVRNNNEEFRSRFIKLFGELQLSYLSYVQTLLQQFDLSNTNNFLQALYQDATTHRLVRIVFRNRVVDYIERNLDNPTQRNTNHDGELTFRNLIQENNEIASNYLERMRQSPTWGGVPEILAMSNLINTNINVNTSVNYNDYYQPINQNANNNNIAISYVELEKGSGIHNHYNFALPEHTIDTSSETIHSITDNTNIPVVDTTNRQDNLPQTTPNPDANAIKLPVNDHGQHHTILSNNNKDDDSNYGNNIINSQISTTTKAINQYNALSKEEKLKKLNEINRYYQTLSENDKKAFKEKLTNTGLAALSGGALTAYGTKMTVSGTAATSVTNAEAMEMTPLLSTSTTESLATAETITVAETAAVEGGVIAGETGTAAALAPETLGLSLVIGGLAIAGTWMYFAFHHHATSNIELPTSIHHNVYDNIEKWYKFLAHDKLKIKINKNTWNEIKQNKNSQANIIKIIKNKFVINDHSGWGGSVTNEDFNTFVKVIVLHFEQINGYFEILDNENDGFVIITNTEGDWLGIE